MKRLISLLRDEPSKPFSAMGLGFMIPALQIAISAQPESGSQGATPWMIGGLFSLALGILLTETPRLLRVPPVGATPAAFLLLLQAALALSLLAGEGAMAHAVHLLSLAGLSVFLGIRIVQKGNRPHPGPMTALLGTACFAAGDAAALAASLGLLPESAGAALWRAGAQAFFLLFAAAAVRWSRGEGLHRAGTHEATASLRWGWSLLQLSLGLEAVAVLGDPSPWLLRAAYALRIAWIAWQMHRPRGCWSLASPSPAWESAVRGGYLLLLAAATLIFLRAPSQDVLPLLAQSAGILWILLAHATGLAAGRKVAAARGTLLRI